MLKSLKEKKIALILGLGFACVFCAVDLNLIQGMPFEVAQIASSTMAVILKLFAVFARS